MKTNFSTSTQKNPQERREQIVRAATSIIAKDGLSSLSIRTVAARADCSRGLVEHYFGNKTALLIAAKDWANNAYLQRVKSEVGELSGLSALKLRLKNLIPYDDVILDEWKIRVAFWHQGISTPKVEQRNNQSFYAVYNQLLNDMRHAQEHGEISQDIPIVESSEMLLFMLMGLCTSCISDEKLRTKAPLDRRLNMILSFLEFGNAASLDIGANEHDY